MTITYELAFAWTMVILAATRLATLHECDRRGPRIELKGNWLKFRYGMFWRM